MGRKKQNSSHSDGLVNETRLILSGNPAEDFPAWLKSKEKDYGQGLELIEKHTDNRILLKFLRENRLKESSLNTMVENIKIIARKWKK